MKELDDLKAQVAQNVSVEGSAITLIQGLAAKLDALAASTVNPADLVALSTQLKTEASSLAAAVAQNTPAGTTTPTPATTPAPVGP